MWRNQKGGRSEERKTRTDAETERTALVRVCVRFCVWAVRESWRKEAL